MEKQNSQEFLNEALQPLVPIQLAATTSRFPANILCEPCEERNSAEQTVATVDAFIQRPRSTCERALRKKMKSSIVEKLLHILTLVSESKKPRTFSELVTDSGLHKSTLHRMLALGLQYEVLQYDEKNKAYLLGPKLFDLVKSAYQGYDIQIMALDEMMRLHKLVRQNVTIGVPVGSDTVYLRVLEAQQSLGPIPQPGMREPFHCSASGKALMAFRPDSAIKSKLDEYQFVKYTPKTITSARKFLNVLKEVRQLGYAANDREQYDHFVGISAPIFNYLSEPIAVLNIWSLHQQCPIGELEKWSEELMTSTARVTSLIGGKPPAIESLSDL